MANPCLNPQASDFRGYPGNVTVDMWKTNASNPCTINVSTLVYEPLMYNSNDDKYYVTSTHALASGKYFDNPDGQGYYMVIISGVLQKGLEQATNVCNRLPNNEATKSYFEQELKGIVSSYDVYNNYVLVAYSNLHIVVRYTKDMYGAPGKIVAGSLSTMDLGLSNNSLLANPNRIKVNPTNGDFVVYSNGFQQTFKVFTINGVFKYKCNDSTDPSSTTSNLNYKDPLPNDIPGVPANWNGLVGKLTFRDYGSGDSQIDKSTNELWSVEQLDFYTSPGGNVETILVGIWNLNKDTEENRYEIYAIHYNPGGHTFGIPTYVQKLYEVHNYKHDGDELIPSFCISKVVPLNSTSDRVEIVVIFPKWTGSNSVYRLIELKFRASATELGGILPGYSSLGPIRDVNSYSHHIGSEQFRGNLKSEIRRNSSGELILHTMNYRYSKWLYRREVAKQWFITANLTNAAVGLGFALYSWAQGVNAILISGTAWGVIGIVIAFAAIIVVHLLNKPDKHAKYTVVKIQPSSGSSETTYTDFGGHYTSNIGRDSSNRDRDWVFDFGKGVSNTFCVQTGSTTRSNRIYVFFARLGLDRSGRPSIENEFYTGLFNEDGREKTPSPLT